MGSRKATGGRTPIHPLVRWPWTRQGRVKAILRAFGPGRPDLFVDPFLGGGAFPLWAWSQGHITRMLIGDSTRRLMAALDTVRMHPEPVAMAMAALPRKSWREVFVHVREHVQASDPDSHDPVDVAFFLWLNRAVTGGAVRLRQDGRINASAGAFRILRLPEREHIIQVAGALRHAGLHCGDWRETLARLEPVSTWVLLDVPRPSGGRWPMLHHGPPVDRGDVAREARRLSRAWRTRVVVLDEATRASRRLYADAGLVLVTSYGRGGGGHGRRTLEGIWTGALTCPHPPM